MLYGLARSFLWLLLPPQHFVDSIFRSFDFPTLLIKREVQNAHNFREPLCPPLTHGPQFENPPVGWIFQGTPELIELLLSIFRFILQGIPHSGVKFDNFLIV
jgi:hypothetical protein